MKKLWLLFVLPGACTAAPPDPLPEGIERPAGVRLVATPRETEDSVESLDLDGALRRAERAHLELAQARARVEAAEGREVQAGLPANPSLVGRMESAPTEARTVRDAQYVGGLSLSVPLGGRLEAAREAARLEAERLRRELEVETLNVRARVHGAFATALFASRTARLYEEGLELARRSAGVLKVRAEAGDATRDELARGEMEEARARLEEDKAHGLRELAFVALASAMGAPELRIGEVEGRLESALELPILESLTSALETGPHAALAQSDVESARARVDLARAERIPDVSIDLFYRRFHDTGIDAFDAGFALPLGLFDRKQGRIREMEAGRREAEARAGRIRGEAVRRVREAHVKLQEAMSHSRLVRGEIAPRAEEVLKIAEARRAAGDLSLAELLAVRRESLVVRLAELDALREVMEAWSELRPYLRR